MPTVPLAKPLVDPQVRGPVYQNIGGANNPASFGGDTGGLDKAAAALGNVSTDIERAVIKQQVEDNEREAKNLDVKLSAALRGINYGDGTHENPGFLSAKGEDALKVSKAAQEAILKAQKDVGGSTKSERVRTLFNDMAKTRVEHELGVVDAHVQQQRTVADNTISEARLAEAVNDSTANYADPAVMKRSLSIANGEISAQAQRNGWGEEVQRAKLAEARSVIVSGAVKAALAADNVEQAQRVFSENSGTLDAATRVTLTAALQHQTVSKQGQTIADKLYAKYGGDVPKALAELQQIATGKVRDSVWEHYNSILGSIHASVNFGQAQTDRVERLREQALSKARADIQFKWSQDEHQRTLAERTRKDEVQTAYDEWVTKIGLNENITPEQVAVDKRLNTDPAKKDHLYSMIRAADRGEPAAAVSRDTTTDLMSRIALPDGDPNKITDEKDINAAFVDGKLVRADLNFLRKEFADARTPEGNRLIASKGKLLEAMKGQIMKSNPISGTLDQSTAGQFYNYSQWVDQKIAAARKAGEDPYELLNPSSPKFVGAPGALAPFQKTLQESLDYVRAQMQRSSAPADYKSLADLQAAQAANKISREDAVRIARDKKWIK